MVPATSASFDLRKALSGLFKQLIFWIPIVGGLAHQFLMYLFNVQGIYVFVNPPGYVYPFVSLEFQWWIFLLLGSSFVCFFVYSERLQGIPARVAFPFYIYILFLLILVKPV